MPYSPYDVLINNINESLHVYKNNDFLYQQNILSVLEEAIEQITYEPENLIKVYNKSDVLYAKIELNGKKFDLTINTIIFYIGINPNYIGHESDALNKT